MVCFKTEPNKICGFSQNRTETELEKSIPHIPNVKSYSAEASLLRCVYSVVMPK